jgi:hypothetical protein
MRATRTLTQLATAVALTAALTGVAACGADKDSGAKAGSSGGDGTTAPTKGGGSDTASGGAIDVCTKVTDDEIAKIVGSAVTREEIPGGGCSFSQDDLRAPSISLNSSAFDEGTGGFDGAVSGVSGVIQGDGGGPLDGVGDEAYAKTGTTPGGSSQQGGGVVHVGGNLFQVTVLQGNGLSAEVVKGLVVDTLNLVATKV